MNSKDKTWKLNFVNIREKYQFQFHESQDGQV